MLKVKYHGVFLMLLLFSLSVKAQNTDTSRIKIDTALLNRYRIDPHRNAIPTRIRSIQVHPELIPLSMLDYKVNYWRKWITFALNFNQSAFNK